MKPQPASSTYAFTNLFMHRWMKTAVFLFLVASVFGTMMRFYYVAEIPLIDYRHLLHAHSHTALLGWGYMFVSGALLFLFIRKTEKQNIYRYLFSLNAISAVGMAIFFVYQGYGAYSIFFSTLHLISVYLFSFHFLRDFNRTPAKPENQFIRWSVIWLLVSTMGLWAIAPVSIFLGKLHPLYYMSVQFFLHFQFNGWFTYAVLGLWVYHHNQSGKNIRIPAMGFWILQLSLLLTYALSITWSTPVSILFYLNSLGVVSQAVAFFIIFKPIFRKFNPFRQLNESSDWLLSLGIGCLFAKIAVQISVALPVVAEISYTIRNYVIGFIHLTMLGSVTLTGVALLMRNQLLPNNRISNIGWLLLGTGFIVMEALLFGQGTLLWMEQGFIANYYKIMLYATAVLPVALFIVMVGFRGSGNKRLELKSITD